MSYTYFIQQGMEGPIKIGTSITPHKRLEGLQTGNPVKLSLLGFVQEAQCSEKDCHAQYKDFRLNGEWFKNCDEVSSGIARLISQFPNIEERRITLEGYIKDRILAEEMNVLFDTKTDKRLIDEAESRKKKKQTDLKRYIKARANAERLNVFFDIKRKRKLVTQYKKDRKIAEREYLVLTWRGLAEKENLPFPKFDRLEEMNKGCYLTSRLNNFSKRIVSIKKLRATYTTHDLYEDLDKISQHKLKALRKERSGLISNIATAHRILNDCRKNPVERVPELWHYDGKPWFVEIHGVIFWCYRKKKRQNSWNTGDDWEKRQAKKNYQDVILCREKRILPG